MTGNGRAALALVPRSFPPVVPHRSRYRSIVLLLALGLGGIATPLLHQAGHLLEVRAEETPGGGVLTVEDVATGEHECVLCEVRLHAAEVSPEDGLLVFAQPTMRMVASGAMPTAPQRAYDGRAPPVLG